MMRLLKSTWLTALIGCVLYLGVTAALFSPGKFAGLRASIEGDSAPAEEQASWKFHNPEFDQWVEEIRRQREALTVREQQLQELQTRLQSERAELNHATQLVAQLQADFDKNVLRISVQEVDNLKRQAKVLSGMSPDGAAVVLGEMVEEEAVRILVTMKPDDVSPILEALSKLGKTQAKQAATLTERMRRTLPADSAAKTSPRG